MKYRKKPIVVEAIQYTGDNYTELAMFMKKQYCTLKDGELVLDTSEGYMEVSV